MMKRTLALSALLAGLATGAAADTLVVRLNSDIRGTDGVNRDANTDTVLHHVFETLVAFRDDLTVGPLLAESWEVSEDGKTYSFTLREGAMFHNGDPVTSQDVKWNWERRNSEEVDWFCKPYFDGSQGLEVTSVETPDERTVVFNLAGSNALFLAQLANIQCNMWIASPENANDDGSWKQETAIGSGPFMLGAWEKGQSITLEKFADYAPLDTPMSGLAGDRTAKVDEVEFLIVPDQSTAETALYAGQIDVLPGLDAAKIEEAEGKGMAVSSTAGLSFTPILIQTDDDLMSDVRLRRAISHAVDFEAIAEARSYGLAEWNSSAVAQASAYFDADFREWPGYDLEKSRALLDEAGYDGEPIVIQTNSRYTGMYENGVLLQAMLQQAGINAELQTLEWATQLDNYLAGTFQIQSFGYSARLDPAQMYGVLLGDKEERPTAQWENARAEELLLESMQTTDFDKRKALFKEIHGLMVEDVPLLGLYYEPVVDAVSPRLEGYSVWPGDKTRAWGVSKTD
ncbi:ABC transporter substrate-binding protein [Aquicoccus porphyridii]|uniref:ABC transporter substrate-binding protein n=1 Tax=Aquicoccus porphyridii TaxID=1852029 RepID=UPI00273F8E7A|nr:ABC transporter substrate-binding protein [Aquicoccus porphyridii]